MKNDAPPALAAVRYKQTMSDARAKELEQSLKQAIAAVPESLQNLLVAMGGDIRVTSLADVICGGSFQASTADSSFKSCFVAIGTYGSKQENISIIVADRADAIETSLVRAFGYFVSQYATRLYVEENGNLQLRSTVPPELAKVMSDMASAFAVDTGITPGEGDLLKLAGYVFAEAFDSWHCSPTTKARMLADFPEVTKIYHPLDENVLEQVEKFLRGEIKRDPAPMALTTDQWSPFHYPLLEPEKPNVAPTTTTGTPPSTPSTPSTTPPASTSGITVTIVDEAGTLDASDVTVNNTTSEDVTVNIVPGQNPPATGDTVVTTGGTQPDVPPTTTDVPPSTGDVVTDTIPPLPPSNDPIDTQPLTTKPEPNWDGWQGGQAYLGC